MKARKISLAHVFLAIILVLYPSAGYSFNLILLYDPDFQRFILLEVPLLAAILMALPESFLLQKIPGGEKLALYKLYWKFVLTNLFIFLVILLSSFVVLVATSRIFHNPQIPGQTVEPVIINIALIYFAAAFIYVSYTMKSKKALDICGEKAKTGNFKRKLFFINLVSYVVFYFYLYNQVF